MKKSKKIFIALSLAVCALTVLCANLMFTVPANAQTYVPVTGISMNSSIHWSSGNTSIAGVDQNGEVTGRSAGLVDIAVTSVSPSLSSIYTGDTVTFNTVIRNISNVPFDGIYPIYVDLYVDGKNLGRTSFYRYDIPSGGMKVLALTPKWTAISGTHEVKVVVNPPFPYSETDHAFSESNYENNTLKTRFTVSNR